MTSTANGRCCRSGKPLGIIPCPKQHVCVKQYHREDSQSSGGTAGDSISPTVRNTPFKLPMNSRFGGSAGTSFATGFPRFVITRGSLVERTSSISVRQRALNSAAAIVLMGTL